MTIRDYLADPNCILVLDGGLGTELENAGCDLDDPLWSGKILIECPHLIRKVHRSYLDAGCRCIIAATYQITPEMLMKHRGMQAETANNLIEEATKLARRARDDFLEKYAEEHPNSPLPEIFIAGSVGSYGCSLFNGSEYRGDFTLTKDEFKDFHRLRMAALRRSGVDVLAIETQPSALEVYAILELLETEFPDMIAWVSFTMSPHNPHTCIGDGTPLSDIVPVLDAASQVIGIGVNCIPLADAASVLKNISRITKKPLVAYPNSGEIYNGETSEWLPSPNPSQTLCDQCLYWADAGGRILGGCCRTGPEDIRKLRSKLKNSPWFVQ